MKLLLAEDEPALNRAVSVILEKGGYMVDTAFDGDEAWEKLAAQSYDGAVLDIMMPGTDGITVLRKLRSRGDLTPVLLLTAKSETDDKVEGLDSGANDYLTKPFAAKELLARVRAMLHIQAAQNTCLRLGNLRLERATNEMSTSTGSFRLSSRESKLLELLLLSPGHPISRERIMERIFDTETTDTSAVVLYVNYLRKKLEALHADVEILSKTTADYMLEIKQ